MILGFCRPQASAQGLLMINIQVQCPMLLWVGLCVMIPEIQCWWFLHHFLITV